MAGFSLKIWPLYQKGVGGYSGLKPNPLGSSLSCRRDHLGRGGSQIAGLLAKLWLVQGFPKASGKWLCRCFRWTLENFLASELSRIRVNLLMHRTNHILLWRYAVQTQAQLPTGGGVSWFLVQVSSTVLQIQSQRHQERK